MKLIALEKSKDKRFLIDTSFHQNSALIFLKKPDDIEPEHIWIEKNSEIRIDVLFKMLASI